MHAHAHNRWLATFVVVLLITFGLPVPTARAVVSCANPVACENQLPGTPQSVWDDGTDDPSILGYRDADERESRRVH